MTEFPDHPFWDFSLRVYMSPGVGAACVELQEAHQLDVNILLFCCWVGASGRGAMTRDDMAAATGAVARWHEEVVRPLRAVRTGMKGGMPPAPDALAESLRRRIQKTEIDCEHTEQLMLAATAGDRADAARAAELRAEDAAANIGLYFQALGRSPGDADRKNCAVVLGVAFADVAGARIAETCRGIRG